MEDKPYFQHPQPQSNQPNYGQVYSSAPDTAQTIQDIQDLRQRIQMLEQKRVNLNTGLIGLFETVTVAPTITPANPYDQIKLANISGTFYLYVYNTNSNSWKRVTIS
jgi:hypothetical protein